MKSNIEDKKTAFEYILYKMQLWREEIPPIKHSYLYKNGNYIEDPGNLSTKNDFTILLPFFICIANKDRKALFSLFNNFCAEKTGIIEKDINIAFEQTKTQINLKKSNNSNIPYKLIDQSIDNLRSKNGTFVNFPFYLLSFYSQRHCSWIVWSNQKTNNHDIPIEILIKERSIFSGDINLLSFS